MLKAWIAFTFAVIVGVGCAANRPRHVTEQERAQMLVELGNASLEEGDPTGALEALFQAEKAAPDMPEIYHSEALAFEAKHDLPTALTKVQHALSLKPDYSAANTTIGMILIDLGRGAEAVPYLQRATVDPLNRETFKALTGLGIISYRSQQYAKAAENFDLAIQANPVASCIAYYYRGHLELQNRHFTDAIRDYQAATQKICGSFSAAHLAIGIAYEDTKQYQLARRKYLEIEQKFPNSKIADQAVERLRYLP